MCRTIKEAGGGGSAPATGGSWEAVPSPGLSPSVLSIDYAGELHFTLIKGLSAEAARAQD